jgi:hypothetical protein
MLLNLGAKLAGSNKAFTPFPVKKGFDSLDGLHPQKCSYG